MFFFWNHAYSVLLVCSVVSFCHTHIPDMSSSTCSSPSDRKQKTAFSLVAWFPFSLVVSMCSVFSVFVEGRLNTPCSQTVKLHFTPSLSKLSTEFRSLKFDSGVLSKLYSLSKFHWCQILFMYQVWHQLVRRIRVSPRSGEWVSDVVAEVQTCSMRTTTVEIKFNENKFKYIQINPSCQDSWSKTHLGVVCHC